MSKLEKIDKVLVNFVINSNFVIAALCLLSIPYILIFINNPKFAMLQFLDALVFASIGYILKWLNKKRPMSFLPFKRPD